jgi:hypothetical protein
MNVPLFITITTAGGIYLSMDRTSAIALAASPALRVELRGGAHTATKIAQISGNSPSYTLTATNNGELSTQHAITF